jgi:hypothetical protein
LGNREDDHDYATLLLGSPQHTMEGQPFRSIEGMFAPVFCAEQCKTAKKSGGRPVTHSCRQLSELQDGFAWQEQRALSILSSRSQIEPLAHFGAETREYCVRVTCRRKQPSNVPQLVLTQQAA